MKTSVTSYSFGGYIAEDRLGYLGLINKAKEMGFEGIEYTDGGYMNEPESAKKIRERAAEQGIEVVALAVGANFIQGSGGNLKDEIARVCKIVDYAAEMGAKLMRHDVAYGFGGERKHTRGYDDALPRLAEGCREVTKYAEQKGVKTMTENHGYFSQDAHRVEKLINTVGHDNFGALVDLGNFMCADEDPTLSVSIMAPYAFHVHAKDFTRYEYGSSPLSGSIATRGLAQIVPTVCGTGDVPLERCLAILKAVGYDGCVSIEYEGALDCIAALTMGLSNLKKAFERI